MNVGGELYSLHYNTTLHKELEELKEDQKKRILNE